MIFILIDNKNLHIKNLGESDPVRFVDKNLKNKYQKIILA